MNLVGRAAVERSETSPAANFCQPAGLAVLTDLLGPPYKSPLP